MHRHAPDATDRPPIAVSVVIPLYNKQRTIERAVRSVLAQSLQDFEVIVVDDGSTDASMQRLREMGVEADPRFILVEQVNGGPGRARNEGARRARSAYLAFLDADDEWQPEHLRRAVHALERAPGCGMHVAAYDTGHYQSLQPNLLLQAVDRSGPWSLPTTMGPVQIKTFVDACQISCVVIRTSLFRRLGGFYDRHRCSFGEDTYLTIQAVFGSDICFDIEPLVHFHVEDSELGIKRVGPRPVRPYLIDPEPLLHSCPQERLPQLRALFAYYRMLETEKFARDGNWRAIRALRRQFRWPAAIPSELRLREWKVPLRTLAGSLYRVVAAR